MRIRLRSSIADDTGGRTTWVLHPQTAKSADLNSAMRAMILDWTTPGETNDLVFDTEHASHNA